jgi:hypothetical protein
MPSDVVEFPAPELTWPPPKSKWEREYAAFRQLLPALLKTYPGEFVAVHDGAVVAHGSDEVAVIQSAHAKAGYVAIHVGRVTPELDRIARIPSPRIVPWEGPQ